MSKRVYVLGVLLALISAHKAAGQGPPATPAEAAALTEKAKIIQKKAQDLLDNVAGRATNLHSPGNRIKVEFGLVYLLWSRDEKRARELFKSGTAEMVSYMNALEAGDQESMERLGWMNQQRMEIT